jgi:pyroglutamyl-peptidase
VKRVLLTGFEPFNNATLNPSKEVVEKTNHRSIVAKEVLPVVFSKAAKRLIELIEEVKPEVVIALGQAEGRPQINLERVAINYMQGQIADNEGVFALSGEISKDAPAAYFSTLPLELISQSLTAVKIPVAISLSAGSFLCNHIFYSMQHHLHGKGAHSGFIHLPLISEQSNEFPNLATIELEMMLKAINTILDVITEDHRNS